MIPCTHCAGTKISFQHTVDFGWMECDRCGAQGPTAAGESLEQLQRNAIKKWEERKITGVCISHDVGQNPETCIRCARDTGFKSGQENANEQAKEAIQEWAGKQGHERCWYYPDIFRKLAAIFGIVLVNDGQNLPESEFEAGCNRFRKEEYHGNKDNGRDGRTVFIFRDGRIEVWCEDKPTAIIFPKNKDFGIEIHSFQTMKQYQKLCLPIGSAWKFSLFKD